MNILLYRYNSICEPDIINTFKSLGIDVIEECAEMNNKKITPSEQVAILSKDIEEHKPIFVFSINFFPAIAEVCHIYRIAYVCWTVDSPVMELYSKSVTLDTNRIFLFDQAQYQTFAPYNPEGIHYLPLASAVERFDDALAKPINQKDLERFSCDISFVGSLYTEKNKMNFLTKPLDNFTKGYIDGVVSASLKVYGANFTENCVTDEIIKALKASSGSFFHLDQVVANPDAYIVANDYMGIQVTEEERIQILNTLAQYFKIDLFTRSDTSRLKNVRIHDGINSLTEMPHLFRNSKINLNPTTKSIQTGLPLRIFDIMGCGGFVMTNYQAELPEYFEIGVDLEAYGSMEELVDKCAYYLEHEDERKQIALNGYNKVCEQHRYIHRIKEMIATI